METTKPCLVKQKVNDDVWNLLLKDGNDCTQIGYISRHMGYILSHSRYGDRYGNIYDLFMNSKNITALDPSIKVTNDHYNGLTNAKISDLSHYFNRTFSGGLKHIRLDPNGKDTVKKCVNITR